MNQQLRDMLNQGISDKGISISKLSEDLNIERTTLSKYINGQRIPNIEYIIKINCTLLSNPEDRVLATKLLSPDLKNFQSMKVALEAARLNRDIESEMILIDKLRSSSKINDREWGNIYEDFLLHKQGTIGRTEFLKRTLEANPVSEELHVYLQLMHMFYHLNLSGDWPEVIKLIGPTYKMIEQLPDSIIKDCYSARLYTIHGTLGLRLELLEPEEVRSLFELAKKHTISNISISNLNYNIGTTYQFSNPLQGASIIREEANFWEKLQIPGLKNSAPILKEYTCNVFKITGGALDEIDVEKLKYADVKMYYYTKAGNHDKVLEIFNELSEDEQNGEFALLCKGIAEENIPVLFQSYMKFIDQYDFFESTYAAIELERLGVENNILSSIKKYRFDKERHRVDWK